MGPWATSEVLPLRISHRSPPTLDGAARRYYNVYKHGMVAMSMVEVAMERTIGATELRRRLTDVLNAVREEHATYVIETFERSQAALVHLDEYRQFQEYRQEREAFFDWLRTTAARNAERNRGLSEDEILAIIEAARQEVAEEE
jgi:PHD/YefM family antitoxin component YafN of YafNO toxin-antitoxin module